MAGTSHIWCPCGFCFTGDRFRKEDTNYKGELILTIACCLVTLVAKSIYIAGGQKETLIVIGKMEYLGKCFGNYCALMFIMRWRNIKIPQWFIHTLLAVNVGFYILIATVDYHHCTIKITGCPRLRQF